MQFGSRVTWRRCTVIPRSAASAITMASYCESPAGAASAPSAVAGSASASGSAWAGSSTAAGGAGGAMVAAAWAPASASPDRIAESRSISGVVSAVPSPPSPMSLTMPSSMSRHANSASVTSVVTGAAPSRSLERTSSMRCVSPAMRSKPMVALMPFNECATLKIVLSASPGSSGSRSRSRIEAFRA